MDGLNTFGSTKDVTIIGFGMSEIENYIEKHAKSHYHGPSDEYSEDWELSGAVQDLQLYYMVGKDIASGNDWPKWNEGAEFKAARGTMMMSVIK